MKLKWTKKTTEKVFFSACIQASVIPCSNICRGESGEDFSLKGRVISLKWTDRTRSFSGSQQGWPMLPTWFAPSCRVVQPVQPPELLQCPVPWLNCLSGRQGAHIPSCPRLPQLTAAWEMQLYKPLCNSGLKIHCKACLEQEVYNWWSKKCYRCQTNGKVNDSCPLPGCRERKPRHFGSIWLSNCCVQIQGCRE